MIFMRKCTKMGTHMEGAKPPQNLSFSPWDTLGIPWGAQGHKMEPKGAKMIPRTSQIEVLGSKTAPRMCATMGTGTLLASSEKKNGEGPT